MRHGKSAAGVRHGTALPHEPGHASCTRPALSVTAALNLQHVHPVRLGTVTQGLGGAAGPLWARFAAVLRPQSGPLQRSGLEAAAKRPAHPWNSKFSLVHALVLTCAWFRMASRRSPGAGPALMGAHLRARALIKPGQTGRGTPPRPPGARRGLLCGRTLEPRPNAGSLTHLLCVGLLSCRRATTAAVPETAQAAVTVFFNYFFWEKIN